MKFLFLGLGAVQGPPVWEAPVLAAEAVGGIVDGVLIAASSTSTARRNSSFGGWSSFNAVSKSLRAGCGNLNRTISGVSA